MTQTAAPRFGIGIDTGGTYTDAVLLDLSTHEVLQTAKVPTTHQDLRQGVGQALAAVLQSGAVPAAAIELVAVSTTLATNAVLEDRGASVGFIAVGFASPLQLPVLAQHYVPGGHTIGGRELEPLDLEALLEGVTVMRRCGVDTYAVCAAMSMDNNTHEQVAARAIAMVDPKPVFCSHSCSDKPGFKDRAATVVLNARLMPVMQRFAEGVAQSMRELGLDCPARIIRGDAGHLPLADGPLQAASTVGSGPAATTWFGIATGGLQQALVVDVGGTSTDVTLLRDGHPVLSTDGARIGEWDTHVQSVQMYTAAVGGDSHAYVGSAGRLRVGPRRVLPLCMAGPELPDPLSWLGTELHGKCLLPAPPERLDPESAENPIVRFLQEHGPATPETVREALRFSSADMERRLDHLARHQALTECGFTPTDALHALGRLALRDAGPALAGARALSRVLHIKGEEVCDIVVGRAQALIEDAILRYMLRQEAGNGMGGILEKRRDFKQLRLHFTLGLPLIGVGAAAGALLPGVADTLGCELFFPEYYQVGNALGALLLAATPENADRSA